MHGEALFWNLDFRGVKIIFRLQGWGKGDLVGIFLLIKRYFKKIKNFNRGPPVRAGDENFTCKFYTVNFLTHGNF